MSRPLITKIQKYSIHDGRGIRTTVFFKGCPLSCCWCHNPETQRYDPEVLFYGQRCVGCGCCAACCPKGAVSMRKAAGEKGRLPETNRDLCAGCGDCVMECLGDARELCGTRYELSRLEEELLKDQPFYETSGGGITLSGGEVMAQDMDYVAALAKRLWERGVSVNVDTCGDAAPENFRRIIQWTDTFLFDLKIMDGEAHRFWTGCDNRRILDNLRLLSDLGARIWIRIPLVRGVNDSRENLEQTAEFLLSEQIRYEQLNLLPYHDTGREKYGHLDRSYEGERFQTPDREQLEKQKEYLESRGIGPVIIGG